MYNGYQELAALPAEAYLEWQNFATPFDSLPENVDLANEQYYKGLEIGEANMEIHLSVKGVWSATGKDRANTHSSEGIGYHACTKDLLHGFLDSGCPIYVHRWTKENGLTSICINPYE